MFWYIIHFVYEIPCIFNKDFGIHLLHTSSKRNEISKKVSKLYFKSEKNLNIKGFPQENLKLVTLLENGGWFCTNLIWCFYNGVKIRKSHAFQLVCKTLLRIHNDGTLSTVGYTQSVFVIHTAVLRLC